MEQFNRTGSWRNFQAAERDWHGSVFGRAHLALPMCVSMSSNKRTREMAPSLPQKAAREVIEALAQEAGRRSLAG